MQWLREKQVSGAGCEGKNAVVRDTWLVIREKQGRVAESSESGVRSSESKKKSKVQGQKGSDEGRGVRSSMSGIRAQRLTNSGK